jgi:glycosyltransferase involved in cell wall biosynthesis
MVLPSEYEPFGLVVNEAMLCGCPVAVSDRVGSGDDLVSPGQNGFVFPVGNVDALADILRSALSAPAHLRELGDAARRRMSTWAPADYIEALVRAVDQACNFKNAN